MGRMFVAMLEGTCKQLLTRRVMEPYMNNKHGELGSKSGNKHSHLDNCRFFF